MGILGVEKHALRAHEDERQIFAEMFKDLPIRQVSVCKMNQGVEKLRHYHKHQTDWWCVVHGSLSLFLHDVRADSETLGQSSEFLLTGNVLEVVRIPPMVLHGCRVFEAGTMLVYGTSSLYDPNDEFRVP